MRYPKLLKTGDTIGFAAPSFGASIEPYKTLFEKAIKYFENSGYKLQLGPNCYEGSGYGISNTPSKCSEELMNLYTGNDCDIIISVGGGECMNETIECMDFEIIRKSDPKWFMGYSDNTNFSFLLNTLCDCASIYGPHASSFGMKELHQSLLDAMEVLKGKTESKSYDKWELYENEDDPYGPYNCTETTKVKGYLGNTPYDKLSVRGRLIGGCLDIVSNLCGTKYDKVKDYSLRYKDDGLFWFLESCDLSVLDFRRTLWKLKNAGYFENATAIMLGRPFRYGESAFGKGYEETAIDILGDLNITIIVDADFGHLPPAMPIVSGSIANAVLENNMLTINYEYI